MELKIRPEDLRPGVTFADVQALLNAGAGAARAAEAGLTPEDLASPTEDASPAPLEAPEPDADGHVPGAMVEGPQPLIELPGQLALPMMMAASATTLPAATI